MENRTFATKEDFRKFASTYGCTTHYSGEDKTMYVKGARAQECIDSIDTLGMTIAFKLKVKEVNLV